LVPRATSVSASPTGTAGVAGLITETRERGVTGDVLVVLSGIAR